MTAVVFTPDFSTVITGSTDKTLHSWCVRTGGSQAVFKGHTGAVTSLVVTPDNK